MKVFISWSGETSKKIASVFREWLPTVIQSLDPFMSSEDIEKGSRWNTDIAQKLGECTFGVICVTKENLNSPWLNFEAGALSKIIDNSYVAPLLFEIKPSELKGSPISQFQSTLFTKEDMKRLIETLNTATGGSLSSTRLDRAFDLCYPDLEKSIEQIKSAQSNAEIGENNEEKNKDSDSNILEELLEMTRNTQRLIGNTDSKIYNNIDSMQEKLDGFIHKIERNYEFEMRKRNNFRISPMLLEDILMIPTKENDETIFPYNVLMLFSIYKEDLPWLYDACLEMTKVLSSNVSVKNKSLSIKKFQNIIEYSFSVPIIRDRIETRKELSMLLHEIPRILYYQIERAEKLKSMVMEK